MRVTRDEGHISAHDMRVISPNSLYAEDVTPGACRGDLGLGSYLQIPVTSKMCPPSAFERGLVAGGSWIEMCPVRRA
jgi:hypothetical protein